MISPLFTGSNISNKLFARTFKVNLPFLSIELEPTNCKESFFRDFSVTKYELPNAEASSINSSYLLVPLLFSSKGSKECPASSSSYSKNIECVNIFLRRGLFCLSGYTFFRNTKHAKVNDRKDTIEGIRWFFQEGLASYLGDICRSVLSHVSLVEESCQRYQFVKSNGENFESVEKKNRFDIMGSLHIELKVVREICYNGIQTSDGHLMP